MSAKEVKDPVWWRLGWVPCVVLILVAAAADLCFPVLQMGMRYRGCGSALGVLLFMTALLLLRRDFTRREQVFLVLLAVIAAAGLLVCGCSTGWLMALTLPFAVIMVCPGREIPLESGVEYRGWLAYWRGHRGKVRSGVLRKLLPMLISMVVGVVCFIAFLCIFASGNPVVQMVWEWIVLWWNRVMSLLRITEDFWVHALIWGAGILSFGIFAVQRPRTGIRPVAEPAAESAAPAGSSILPQLPFMVLLGVNLAFLITTATDVAFLWFRRVPEGISQTEYLYEGAESIVWAAVLASALLIYFFRRRGSVRCTVLARGLGYLLLVQTLLLAGSVYVRLFYQIQQYAFTPRRILAAEFLLLGVAGLVILFCYMVSSGGFLRHARLCVATLGLLALSFTISPPAALSGDLNMRLATSNPSWTFTLEDFNSSCFQVEDNLCFALHVFEQVRRGPMPESDEEREAVRRVAFYRRLVRAAINLEERSRYWTLFTLRDYWDRRAAEHILGRPITAAAVEPLH